MIDGLVATASLPCASCGYPIVDSALRWHPWVYVTGRLAELELGPTARNIAGARRAGDRLVDASGEGRSLRAVADSSARPRREECQKDETKITKPKALVFSCRFRVLVHQRESRLRGEEAHSGQNKDPRAERRDSREHP